MRRHVRFAQLGPRTLEEREGSVRSEEHTSELQSPDHLVCRLLLEKKKHAGTAAVVDRASHEHHATNSLRPSSEWGAAQRGGLSRASAYVSRCVYTGD